MIVKHRLRKLISSSDLMEVCSVPKTCSEVSKALGYSFSTIKRRLESLRNSGELVGEGNVIVRYRKP